MGTDYSDKEHFYLNVYFSVSVAIKQMKNNKRHNYFRISDAFFK